MPAAQRQELAGGLVCYARYVVHRAWPRLEAGTEGDRFNPWGVAMFRTLQQVEPNGRPSRPRTRSGSTRTPSAQQARQDRIHGGAGRGPDAALDRALPDRGVISSSCSSSPTAASGRVDAGAADRLRRRRGRRDAAPAVVPRQPVLRRASAALQPVAMERTLEHPRRGARPHRLRPPAPVRRVRRPAADATAVTTATSRSSRPSCCRSPPSQRRGAATRRRAGTASRRRRSSRTNAIRVEAARAQGLSESQTQVDVATFIQWVDAYALKRTELADFYFKRFRKEFRPGRPRPGSLPGRS